jgi:hypothetical protein
LAENLSLVEIQEGVSAQKRCDAAEVSRCPPLSE